MADWTKTQLLADIASMYIGVGTPVNPGSEGSVNGVTKYIVNVNEYGSSENNRKPTGYRKNLTFYVYNEGLGDEKAWYEISEPTNTSDGNVAIASSSYEAIAKLYNSKILQDRTLAAIITQCSIVFQEVSSSSTSLTIGISSQSLTVNTGKSYTTNQQMTLSNGTNSMGGTVTSYNSTTGALVVNVTTIVGTGTFTSWTVTPTNHTKRMNLVSSANANMPHIIMSMMSAIAINTIVQTQGTAVTDATLQAIVAGSWDSYASLVADYTINGGI
jgi:hypothetical protein